MIPGMDPRAMKAAMKKMGMKQEDIVATEVIIKTADKEIVIQQPSVAKVEMMGQVSYQISGQEEERATKAVMQQEDIDTVVQQTKASPEQAEQALKEQGNDLAAAILSLQKK